MRKKGIIVIGIIVTIIGISLAFPINSLDTQPQITDIVNVKDAANTTINEKMGSDEDITIIEEKKHYIISARDEPILP